MNQQIFVNLPVKNLEKSKAFFTALGYAFNPQFSNENGACMIISEGSIFAMLTTETFFRTFTHKPIVNAKESCEMLLNLSCDSREQVDELVRKALAAGDTSSPAAEDLGFMYSHDFYDLDGHGWGLFHMVPQQS